MRAAPVIFRVYDQGGNFDLVESPSHANICIIIHMVFISVHPRNNMVVETLEALLVFLKHAFVLLIFFL